ncbi:MAG: hypothetical protein IPI23_14200 [Bacteroidetes bacterium]|nr:hypothetical protein [Bacteroidota bacterium]
MGNGIPKIVPTENGRVFFLKVAQMLDIILDDVINRFQNTLHISSAKSDQERIYKDNEKNNLFAKILFDYIDKNGNSNFEYVNKWLNKLKIISDDEQFQVERPADSASVPVNPNSLTGYQRNLIDFGFGTTQIVMFYWWCQPNPIRIN